MTCEVHPQIRNKHGENFSTFELIGDIYAVRDTSLNNLEFGPTDFDKNITDLEVNSSHTNPRFVDFRKMPVPILQCFFYPNAWKILCTCIFLNCTRRAQVERIIWKFFEAYPSPEALLAAPDEEVQEIIRPLGFYKRRTTSLKRMSEDFVAGNWKSPEDLRSVGVYAATCYRMMFNFELSSSPPDDHALVDLYNWMKGLSPRRQSHSSSIQAGRLLLDVRR